MKDSNPRIILIAKTWSFAYFQCLKMDFVVQSREMPHDTRFETYNLHFVYINSKNILVNTKFKTCQQNHRNINMHQNIKDCGRFREVQCHTFNKSSLFAWIFRHRSTLWTFSRSFPVIAIRSVWWPLKCFTVSQEDSGWILIQPAWKSDIPTVQRLPAAGAGPNATYSVSRRFYMNSLAIKTHLAQQFLSLAFQMWRDWSKKKSKKKRRK